MRILKPILTVFILGVVVFFFYQWLIFPVFLAKAKMIHMEDPDTLLVRVGGKLKKVQLIGVDAPELTGRYKDHQCFDREAKAQAAAKYFSSKREVILESDNVVGDKDIHNRNLRYVKLIDGTLLNEVLLRDGLAKVYNPENKSLKYKEAFLKAEHEARKAGMGIWDQNGCKGLF